MHLLVTGGAGYIGSHTCVELLAAGHRVTVVDNLSNGKLDAVRRVEQITGADVAFAAVDLRDRERLREVFAHTGAAFDAVIHFAGLKAVGESVSEPLTYYHNNLLSTIVLCQLMREFGVTRIIFSSSATVYGNPASVPIKEDFPLSCVNPYGRGKLMVEQILTDIHTADPSFKVVLLRYFNPVGAHASGLIGEDPGGIPNNLMPYISQVAVGTLPHLNVFGDDYPTADGTGVRDYIHVVDLARGHIDALRAFSEKETVSTYNLGTGQGYSVLEMVRTFEMVSGRPIPYQIAPRRPGDVAVCYADPSLAEQELGWRARHSLEDMCRDSWRWQQNNPNGY
jgi:UDP-glucose 4-epimerase